MVIDVWGWVLVGVIVVAGVVAVGGDAWSKHRSWTLERRQMAREKHAAKMARELDRQD